MASSGSSRSNRRRSILKGSRISVGRTENLTDRVRELQEEEINNENENNTTNLISMAGRKRVSFGQRQIKEFQIPTSFTESPVSSILQEPNQTMMGEVDMEMSFGNYHNADSNHTLYGGSMLMSTTGMLEVTKSSTRNPALKSATDTAQVTQGSSKVQVLMVGLDNVGSRNPIYLQANKNKSMTNSTMMDEVDMEVSFGNGNNHNVDAKYANQTLYGGSVEMSTTTMLEHSKFGIKLCHPSSKSATDTTKGPSKGNRLNNSQNSISMQRNKNKPKAMPNSTRMGESDMEMSFGNNHNVDAKYANQTLYGGSVEMSTTGMLKDPNSGIERCNPSFQSATDTTQGPSKGNMLNNSQNSISMQQNKNKPKAMPNSTRMGESNMEMSFGNNRNVDAKYANQTLYGGSVEMSTTGMLEDPNSGIELCNPSFQPATDTTQGPSKGNRLNNSQNPISLQRNKNKPKAMPNSTRMGASDMEMSFGNNQNVNTKYANHTLYGGSVEMSTTGMLEDPNSGIQLCNPSFQSATDTTHGQSKGHRLNNSQALASSKRNKNKPNSIGMADGDMGIRIGNYHDINSKYGGNVEVPTTTMLEPPKIGLELRNPSFKFDTDTTHSAQSNGQLFMVKPDNAALRNPVSFPSQRNKKKPEGKSYGKFLSVKTPKRRLQKQAIPEIAQPEILLEIKPREQRTMVSAMAQTSFAAGPGSVVDVQTSPMVFSRPYQNLVASIGSSPIEQVEPSGDQNHPRSTGNSTIQVEDIAINTCGGKEAAKEHENTSQNIEKETPNDLPNESCMGEVQSSRNQNLGMTFTLMSPLHLHPDRSIKMVSPGYIGNCTVQLEELAISAYGGTETAEKHEIASQNIDKETRNDLPNDYCLEEVEPSRNQNLGMTFTLMSPLHLHPDRSIKIVSPRSVGNCTIQVEELALNENEGTQEAAEDHVIASGNIENDNDDPSNNLCFSTNLRYYLQNYNSLQGMDKLNMLAVIKNEFTHMQQDVYNDVLKIHRQVFNSVFIEAVEISRSRISIYES